MKAKTIRLPKRKEIEDKYKWDLSLIYSNDDLWEQDFIKAKNLSDQFEKYKGSLGKSAETLLACLKLRDEVFVLLDKLYRYANLRKDEDYTVEKYRALADKAKWLETEVSSATAFIIPEMIAVPESTLKKFVEENRELAVYNTFIQMNLRTKEHILSEKEEEMLSQMEIFSDSAHDIYNSFNNADIRFPFIKTKTQEIEITKGNFLQLLENKDRKIREKAFKDFYSTYSKYKNTLASTLAANVKKNIFFAKIRKYDGALHAALDQDNIDRSVYTNLINVVNKNAHLFYRYLKLRKKVLKVKELHMYDMYVPLMDELGSNIPYDKALSTIREGLAPLGEKYINDLESLLKNKLVDIYESEGKASGAYSWGTYSADPYILLNYKERMHDIFTVAHELGHAMHSFYTVNNQPAIYGNYSIFVAEVASQVNEAMLVNYLIDKTSDKREKAQLIYNYLEQFRGSMFRQTMFAEFEKVIFERAEKGESLTIGLISEIYYNLIEKYFGKDIVIDKEIEMEWSRISHFYRSFYVYKYATGFAAANAIASSILGGDKTTLDKYLNFLRSGSTDYPLELLKNVGVDLATPKPIDDALNVFEQLLEKLEELIG